ncbi:hypothetical protein SUGI_0111760 [Cryptomeria japonica]|nr:hypothetical protein SUGI_0111760 [Cryptomeria japonica]
MHNAQRIQTGKKIGRLVHRRRWEWIPFLGFRRIGIKATEPELCVSTSLAGLPGFSLLIPTKLLNAAIKASISLVQKTSTIAIGLSRKTSPGLEKIALQDCIDLLDDTADHLNEVLHHILSLDFRANNFEASNINTFLSAGRTNQQDTCIESMVGTNGVVKLSQLQTSVRRISRTISTSPGMFMAIVKKKLMSSLLITAVCYLLAIARMLICLQGYPPQIVGFCTVDFIFGNAAVVLQRCKIMARKPLEKQTITIADQGRNEGNENTGISIHDCNVTTAPDFVPMSTYLGRPWKEYSRVVFLQCYLDNIIEPQEANKFTVAQFIKGNECLPLTRIPYFPGLKD